MAGIQEAPPEGGAAQAGSVAGGNKPTQLFNVKRTMKRESEPPAVSAKDYLLKRLQDPATAAAYLNAAVEDDDPTAFLQALRNVIDAQGGIGKVASFPA